MFEHSDVFNTEREELYAEAVHTPVPSELLKEARKIVIKNELTLVQQEILYERLRAYWSERVREQKAEMPNERDMAYLSIEANRLCTAQNRKRTRREELMENRMVQAGKYYVTIHKMTHTDRARKGSEITEI